MYNLEDIKYNINPEVLKIYRDYQYERSDIYHKKEVLQLSRPWTDDTYLSKYKFTNVSRTQDKESKFLIRTVCHNDNLSMKNKVLNCLLFRMINCESGCRYLKEWPIDFDNVNWDEFKDYEIEYSKNSNTVMQSNGYFLSQIRTVAYKFNEFLRGTNTALAKFVYDNQNKVVYNSTPEELVKSIMTIPGLGNFMAYQAYSDISYIIEYR
jgi:hypothetical protein